MSHGFRLIIMDPLRVDPFGDGDYDDGEVYRLVPGSILDVALRTEQWPNHSVRSRRNWIRLMDNAHTIFVGTVLSAPRHQLELVVVLELNDAPNRRWMTETVITLNHFERFLR